jgi:hypothetical protein
MLETLAIFSGLTLWAILGIIVVLVGGFVAAKMESAWVATFTVISGVLVADLAIGYPVLAMMGANPLLAIGIILGYAVVGFVYTGLWRWPEFIRENKSYLRRDYKQWAMKVADDTDNSFDAFLESDANKYKARNNKQRLGTYVGMWPFSLTGELLRKPAIWLWNTLYAGFGEIFDRIGKAVARKILSKD